MGKYDAFLNGEIDEPIANAPSTTEPGKAPAGFKNPKYAAFLLGDEGSPSGDRSLGDVGYDLVSSFGVGANALLGMGGTLYGLAGGAVDNWATRQGEFGRKWWQDQKSAQLIDAEDNRKAKIDAAEDELGKLGEALWQTMKSPTLLSAFLAEQVPMLIPGGAAGRAAGAAAKAGGLSATAAGTTAYGAAAGTGGLMQGADAAQQAFDQLLRIPKPLWEKNPQLQDLMASNPSMTFDEAQEEVARGLARNTFAAAAAVSIATNMIPGAMGIERALVGVKAKTGGRLFNAAKDYVGETLQEGIEEGSAALFANIATGALDPEQRYWEGVGEATGMGMAAGPIGGVAGALNANPEVEVDRKRTELQKAVEARLAEAGLLADRESDQGLLPGVPVSIENEDGTTTTKVKIDEGNIRTFETDAPDSDVAKQWLNESLGLFETAQEAKRGPVKRPDGTVAYTDPMNVADAVMSAEGSVDDVIAQSLGIVGQSGAINSRIRQQEYLEDAFEDAGITEPVSRPEPEVSSIADLIGQHVLEQQDLQAAEPLDLEVGEDGVVKGAAVPASAGVVVPPPARDEEPEQPAVVKADQSTAATEPTGLTPEMESTMQEFFEGEGDVQPTAEAINEAAHEAATSPENNLPEPTDAQKEAGNYKKGARFTLHGQSIVIENPKDSQRTGTGEDGTQWSNTMGAHYGDIKRTEGADGDGVDVFVGENPESTTVWMIDQVDQGSGAFDEHKVMMGFADEEAALDAYRSSYDEGWKVGPVTQISTDELRDWIDNGDTTQAYVGNDYIKNARAAEESAAVASGAAAEDVIPNYRGQGRWGKAREQEKINALMRDPVWFAYRHLQDVMKDRDGMGQVKNKKNWFAEVNEAMPGNEQLSEADFSKALLQLVADKRVNGPDGTRRTYRLHTGDNKPGQKEVLAAIEAEKEEAEAGQAALQTEPESRSALQESEQVPLAPADMPLDKITLETAYEVEESGETVNVMENSGKLTRQLAKRANVISELRACIRG